MAKASASAVEAAARVTTGSITLQGSGGNFSLGSGATLFSGGGNSFSVGGTLDFPTDSTLAFDMTGATTVANDATAARLILSARSMAGGDVGLHYIRLYNFNPDSQAVNTVYTPSPRWTTRLPPTPSSLPPPSRTTRAKTWW